MGIKQNKTNKQKSGKAQTSQNWLNEQQDEIIFAINAGKKYTTRTDN